MYEFAPDFNVPEAVQMNSVDICVTAKYLCWDVFKFCYLQQMLYICYINTNKTTSSWFNLVSLFFGLHSGHW